MLKKNESGRRHYRDAMAHFAGAVHVVTTDGPAGKRGTTVIAACSVSDNAADGAGLPQPREPQRTSLFVENGRSR